MIQELSDDFREWCMCRNQDAARRHTQRRDYWRRQIGRSWLELIPPWFPWAALAAFWALVFRVLQ